MPGATKSPAGEAKCPNTTLFIYLFFIKYNLALFQVKLGLQHDLGGFMLWSIETDDFHGDCEKEREGDTHNSNGKFPLLRAVHRAIEDYNLEVKDIDINDINNDISEGNRTRTSSGAAAVTCSLSVIFLLITAFI